MIIDGWVFYLAGPGPAPIPELLLEDFLRFWQLPQALNWVYILSQKIAPYKVQQRLVSR
jgi:hypothetical protein